MKLRIAPLLMLPLLAMAACDGGDVEYSADADAALTVPPPTPAPQEHCYGIAPAGKGVGPMGPDTSEVDFQGNAWVYVKAGTCRETFVAAKSGQARKGSLTPLWRDRPIGPWMDEEAVAKLRAAQKAEAEAQGDTNAD